MIKLIIFDLDGVLIEAKEIHYKALNEALGETFKISWEEHLNKYDGLKTNQKLEMISKEKGLDRGFHKQIFESKQKYTLELLQNIKHSAQLQRCLNMLIKDGYKIACCSNSIRKTVNTVLSKLGIIDKFDLILSNEDVKNSKPHPEIYWKAISELGFLPEETLIVEDSPYGLLAASRSKSNILRVGNPKEVIYLNIKSKIIDIERKYMTTPKWIDKKLTVLIPMAGAGSRFEQAGFVFPKPLIEVNGKPMIQMVIENLNIDANYVYIVQKKHREKYNLDTLLNILTPGCKIVESNGITDGAARTALLAREYINVDSPLFIANSDQYVEWNSNDFFYKMNETKADGGIVTFKSIHPKWSFAKVDNNGLVTEVAEKNPISDNATVGFYYWKKGSDFVSSAEQMIAKNILVNNEFYICPTINELIQGGKRILTYEAQKMQGTGTPEDLKIYLDNYKS